MKRFWTLVLGLVSVSALPFPSAQAQTNSYKQTNLVADTAAPMAAHMDAKLVNPWGIAFVPGNPFWISDNNSGFTTLYDQNGALSGSSSSFTIPPPNGSSNPATPTGIVAPPGGVTFNVNGASALFIFDTEDGTLSAWTGGNSVTLVVDNSKIPSAATGAVYKGLALIKNTTGSFLLATNFRSGKVEVYNTSFAQTQILGAGAFNDPSLPAAPTGSMSPGYAPFGIKAINVNGTAMVVVTYALQDTPMHDPLSIAGAGFVDLFAADGTMLRRVTSDSHLNAPWGVVLPPASFGSFGASGNLLVGNFGDGRINAYNFATGAFVDQMKDQNGTPITNLSLWDMVFGGGGPSGDVNTMYITAGLANEAHGLFSAITANTTPAPTADFNINASPATLTISAGQTASFTVTLGGLNGFNSAVNLTCSNQPANSACSFSPASVTPASGGTATSMMTISTSSNPYMHAGLISGNQTGGRYAMILAVPALVLLGALFFGSITRSRTAVIMWVPSLAGSLVLLLASACLLAASGCGYNAGSAGTGTQRGLSTVMITGTSGSLTHSTSVSLTVQ
jgi:uncharacterized protein (TIGR03118 family)